MNKSTKNRLIHCGGAILCVVALGRLSGELVDVKSLVTTIIAIIGLAGNAYGVWRPNAWLR